MSEFENGMQLTEKKFQSQTQTPSVWRSRQPAVQVRNAFKKYEDRKNANVVLDGFNMTVPTGCIYGLLGASGCGKTTLLNCISGRFRLNAGEILVLGREPGSMGSGVPGPRIGYMPQEIALIKEFSIRESFYYFGWINGMSTEQINVKVEYLINLLSLLSADKYVKHFSGGQQRRLSLACALLHDPELIILDEPTAGVDPILRQRIWDHLVKITANGKTTVIVTTHYVEEARRAHKIGLMRGGCLLAEESPENLLHKYDSDSLEDVFLHLSRMQNHPKCKSCTAKSEILSEGTANVTFDPNAETSGSTLISKQVTFSDEQSQAQTLHLPPEDNGKIFLRKRLTIFKSNHMKALLWKNFLLMWRNVATMSFIIGLPIFEIILFCLCIGQYPVGLPIGIINGEMDGKNTNCTYLPITLQPQICNPQINAVGPSDCPTTTCVVDRLSCRYIELLEEKQQSSIFYHNVEEAKHALQKGKTFMVLQFSSNFTRALQERYEKGMEFDLNSLGDSEISVWIDRSNYIFFKKLEKDLYDAWNDLVHGLSETCGYNYRILGLPFQMNNSVFGTIQQNFRDFAAPGVILTMSFFMGVAFTSGNIVEERSEGILDRNIVLASTLNSNLAGVTEVEILLGYAGSEFIIIVFQTVLLVGVPFLFELTMNGSILTMYMITGLMGLYGMSFAILVCNIADRQRTANFLSQGAFMPLMILSGIIWPIEGMPVALRSICYGLGLPLTLSTDSLRSIMSRGWNLNKPSVYLAFFSTVTWTALFLCFSILLAKFKRS